MTNLKGQLPVGYVNAGARTVNGVGTVTGLDLARATEDADALAQARKTAEAMAAIWGALSSTVNPERRRELIERHGAVLVKAGNQHAALLDKLGLQGPYSA